MSELSVSKGVASALEKLNVRTNNLKVNCFWLSPGQNNPHFNFVPYGKHFPGWVFFQNMYFFFFKLWHLTTLTWCTGFTYRPNTYQPKYLHFWKFPNSGDISPLKLPWLCEECVWVQEQQEPGRVEATVPDILSPAAMHNAYFICHNVQVGEGWERA